MKTFQKELERLSEKDLQELADFWECSPVLDDIYQAISKNFFLKLSSFSDAENKILFCLLAAKTENITEKQLQRAAGLEYEAFRSGYRNLNKKMILYERKSIAKLTSGNNKIFLFELVNEIIGRVNVTNDLSMVEIKITPGYQYIDYRQRDVLKLLFESNGKIDAYSIAAIQNNLEKHYQSGIIGFTLYFDGKTLKPIYHLLPEFISSVKPVSGDFLGKGLDFLARFGTLFAALSTRRVLLNRSGELCKYDQDLVDNIFQDNEIAEYFIQFFMETGILSSDGKTVSVLPSYQRFLHQDINQTFKEILSKNLSLRKFCEDFLKVGWIFSPEDVYRYAYNYGYSKKEAIFALKICYFMGLINQTNEEIYIPSSLFDGLSRDIIAINSPVQSFIVNANFSVVADSEKISLYDDYLFRVFFALESDGKVRIYKIDKKSFLTAVYLGYRPEDLFDTLKNRASKPVPDMIFTVLKDWHNSFKSVRLRTITVFEGNKDVIDILFYNRNMSKYIVKRHGNELLELNSEIENIRYIDDEDIFIIPESQE